MATQAPSGSSSQAAPVAGAATSTANVDAWSLVSAWVDQRRKEGSTVNDVLDLLGLHLLAADQDDETRWALAAIAAAQCRARVAPRIRLVPDADSLGQAVQLLQSCSLEQ